MKGFTAHVKVRVTSTRVTMQATGFRVVYRKPHREPWLVAKGKNLPVEAVQGGVMNKLEAMRILGAKLATVEQKHHAEFADNEDMREQIDLKAEAQESAPRSH